MFRDIDDARVVIKTMAIDEAETPLSPAQVQLLLDRLIAQFWITDAAKAESGLGATRFGGAPDLPKGTAWPMRAIPPDAEKQASEFRQHFEWIAKHIVRELPFEFLAQIDLAEAAKHPDAARGLPDTGRLLFFWDGVVGTMVSGPAVCRVVWDETATSGLSRLEIPALLTELDAAYDPEGKYKKPYIYPERAMRLAPMIHLPDRSSADFVVDQSLAAFIYDGPYGESYALLTSLDEGQFTVDGKRGARCQRFMGAPIPEQDDPRFDAIVADGFPAPPWKGAQLIEAATAALGWQLLLQADLGDLSQQDFTEGTVYFLIRKADLEKRDFSRVHAVYQQT